MYTCLQTSTPSNVTHKLYVLCLYVCMYYLGLFSVTKVYVPIRYIYIHITVCIQIVNIYTYKKFKGVQVRVRVTVYTYVYVCMYVCMYVHMHVHVFIYPNYFSQERRYQSTTSRT